MQKLLTCKEVSQLFGVNEFTIRHWVAEKRIAHLKLGRLVRFEPSEIQKYLEANTVEEIVYLKKSY